MERILATGVNHWYGRFDYTAWLLCFDFSKEEHGIIPVQWHAWDSDTPSMGKYNGMTNEIVYGDKI